MLDLNDHQPIYINHKFENITAIKTKIIAKEFDNCTFLHGNFSHTVFENCRFYECKFMHCNLSLVAVRGCSFFDTVFEDSKTIGINWTQAAWPRIKLSSPLQFHKCVLDHASFFALNLREIAIVECSAQDVDFREADLTEADFSGTDLTASQFGKTKLIKADFSTASNYNIDVFSNEIKRAKFSLPEAVSLLNCLGIELVN